MGANPKSFFFYSQVKGKWKKNCKVSDWWYSHFRPSLLVGNRQEFRFGERMAEKLSRIIPFIFKGAFKNINQFQLKMWRKGCI